MKIPAPISDFFGKHKWIPVLIFGIFIGSSFMMFIYNERIELLKSQIDEYRERLKIPKPNEGPYHNYSNRELKDRALKLSSEIETLCERNPLLSIDGYYRNELAKFRKDPTKFDGASPFRPDGLLWLSDPKYSEAIDRLSPSITKKDVGLTIGDLTTDMITIVQDAIKPELEIYKNQYRNDVIALRNETLSRMPPRAWRHYVGHVDVENPGQFLIGVAIQLKEISDDF